MKIEKIYIDDYPFLLRQISQLPKEMDIVGTLPPETYKYLCVVGARGYSDYGKEACRKIILGLQGYPIVIVSGLAIGIDSIAHEAALDAGLKTIAFPGSGLKEEVIYPAQHLSLAKRIIESDGTLISPFKEDQIGTNWTFPVRNRLMAGISHATLIVEAKKGSGTLLTAGNAGEFNRDILAVPGSIFSELSWGPHELIRDGAIAITCADDILELFEFIKRNDDIIQNDLVNNNISKNTLFDRVNVVLSKEEKQILEKISKPITRDDLINELKLPASFINSVLVELELKELIFERQGLLTLK